MSESVEAREIADIQELLQSVELAEIRTYEASGRRLEESGEPQDVSINVVFRETGSSLEFRVGYQAITAEAELRADIAALYAMRESFSYSEALIREFAERVAFMTIYPYIRESIMSSAARLQVVQPLLQIIRAGEFRLGHPGEEVGQGSDQSVE